MRAEILGERHRDVLHCRHLRASVLDRLGRYNEALSEIDRLAPITAEVFGEHHPNVCATCYLRAAVLIRLGRSEEALREIDQFASAHAKILGDRHPDVLQSHSLRASALRYLGVYEEALREIDQFAPAVIYLTEQEPYFVGLLRLSRPILLYMVAARLKYIIAFAPIQAETLGERHPYVLVSRQSRAYVLNDLGHYNEALEEIDQFARSRPTLSATTIPMF